MNDRLQQFLTLEQLSPARLSEILGVQRSGLSHILSGRNKPGFEFIQRLLLKFPAINAEWLITGKGKMYKELSPADNPVQIPDKTLFSEDIQAPETAENLIKDKICTEDGKKRVLKKMIFIYSDGTFVEYFPSKD
ncbi:MAG: helix-turn-helix transcriptional regulator [Bacteroidales bacterium]